MFLALCDEVLDEVLAVWHCRGVTTTTSCFHCSSPCSGAACSHQYLDGITILCTHCSLHVTTVWKLWCWHNCSSSAASISSSAAAACRRRRRRRRRRPIEPLPGGHYSGGLLVWQTLHGGSSRGVHS